jgi:hypothetical protein
MKMRQPSAEARTLESKTLCAAASSRGEEVENTHHRLSRASSTFCPSCHRRRRPCPPRRRRPACPSRRRRQICRHLSGSQFHLADCFSGHSRCSRLCAHRPTPDPRAVGCQRCSMHSATAFPRRRAPPPRDEATLADAERRAQCRAGRGVRAGASGLWRLAMTCPADRACLPSVSNRVHVHSSPRDRTCSDNVRSRHPSACPAVCAVFPSQRGDVQPCQAQVRRNRGAPGDGSDERRASRHKEIRVR